MSGVRTFLLTIFSVLFMVIFAVGGYQTVTAALSPHVVLTMDHYIFSLLCLIIILGMMTQK